ncbi:uncharacterized protein LOC131243891 isoform X2 [Magnolia sinica]|uniref:uncharacterized protein LOC131243891 isoform X2 n=1 Tax=Magnolia sinica TaxID=86752 RepID=UPI0026590B1E|nr:uncharacterized protein LOC131243891 isoform X2 [Magnolia sinica]
MGICDEINRSSSKQSSESAKLKSYEVRETGSVVQNSNDRLSVRFRSSTNYQKRRSGADELVKYMSDLPCYLQCAERGVGVERKALNVGVLDWGRLERWKYEQERASCWSEVNSPSDSDTCSSSFSAIGSSVLSSRSKSNTSSLLRMKKQSISLKDLMSSSMGDCDRDSGALDEKNSKQNAVSEVVWRKTRRLPETRNSSSDSKGNEAAFCSKEKMKTQQFHELGFRPPDELCGGILNTAIEAGDCKIFSESSDFHLTIPFPGVPYSCPLPCNSQISESLGIEYGSLDSARPMKFPLHRCGSLRNPGETPTIRSQGKYEEQNRYALKPVKLSGLKEAKAANANRRDPSPSPRRLIASLKNSNFFKANASIQLDNSCREDKRNSSGRSKSSPLRRILDPLLKPMTFEHLSLDTQKPFSHKVSASVETACKQSSASLRSQASQPSERNSNSATWVLPKSHDLHQDQKRKSPLTHALLQVSCKNGPPLYTFTFDSCDILAATMTKVCISGTDDFEWIYTFYSVHEVKKKNGGWTNQRSIGKQQYISNVAGRMKVSYSQCPNYMVIESVLSGFGLEQVGHGTSDSPLDCELVAIVVKVPKEKMVGFNGDGLKGGDCRDLSDCRLPKCSSQENSQIGMYLESQNLSSIEIVLPSGVHGMPATGVPSGLIDRWKSGGSCDCGGWDVGCPLKILSVQDQHRKGLNLSPDHCVSGDSHQVDLFIQGGTKENKHVWSLAAFREGLYTVNFDRSISSLQAFSISIAVLHCRQPSNLPEVRGALNGKAYRQPTSRKDDGMKIPTSSQREAPPSHVSYPPLSPFGRV